MCIVCGTWIPLKFTTKVCSLSAALKSQYGFEIFNLLDVVVAIKKIYRYVSWEKRKIIYFMSRTQPQTTFIATTNLLHNSIEQKRSISLTRSLLFHTNKHSYRKGKTEAKWNSVQAFNAFERRRVSILLTFWSITNRYESNRFSMRNWKTQIQKSWTLDIDHETGLECGSSGFQMKSFT